MSYKSLPALAAAFLLVGAGASWAKGMTLDQLQALATGLGYEATVENGAVVIPDQGKTRQSMYMVLADEGAKVELSSPLFWTDGDKRAAIPYEGLLKANGDGPFAFAMGNDDKHSWIYLAGYYDSATLNKQSLRKALDAIVAKLDANDALWNVDLWPAPAAPKSASAPAAPAGSGSVTPAPAPAATPDNPSAPPT